MNAKLPGKVSLRSVGRLLNNPAGNDDELGLATPSSDKHVEDALAGIHSLYDHLHQVFGFKG